MAEQVRLFFALWPSETQRERLWALGDTLGKPPGRGPYRVKRERYHITLLFVGDVAPEWVAPAQQAAAAVQAAPFTLTIDRVGSFPNARVWWLGCSGVPPELSDLWQRLRLALQTTGVPFERSRLTPHLTFMRDVRQAFAPKPVPPVDWPVHEFVLVQSVLGAGAARYEVIGRWPLNGAGPRLETNPQIKLWEDN